jgi:membrane protease YdiL (CAAX protease family)
VQEPARHLASRPDDSTRGTLLAADPLDAAPGVDAASPARRLRLWLELLALFGAVPVALYLGRHEFREWIVATLVAAGAACSAVLLRDRTFDRRELHHLPPLRHELATMLVFRLLPGTALLVALTAWLLPERLFALPREAPVLWLLILVLYPLLSAYPQELIFRAFLFHRYRTIVPGAAALVAVSAVAFALAHAFFDNWVAPALSLGGGLLFASTFARTRSTLLVAIEHGLWGDLLFTVGLGWFFYGGSIAP